MDSQLTDGVDGLLISSCDEHGVQRLTMNNPGARNALSEEMLAALASAFQDANTKNDIRVVVLTANGPVFSAGHDIKQISARRIDEDSGKAYFQYLLEICSELMTSIVRCKKPVIAEVSGVAAAAGLQLAASCDLIVASEEAHFCTPGVNIGLFCSTPMVALSRSISRKHAMEMLLTGEMMDAEVAHRFGLVNRVVATDKLRDETTELARLIASKSSAVLAIGKEAFYNQSERSLDEAYVYCSEVMVNNLMMRDSEEGLGAFIEKRDAKWEDR